MSLLREQLAVVGVDRDAVVRLAGLLRVEVVDELLAVLDAAAVEVAHGHDARRVVLPACPAVVAARDAPDADGADVDAVARRVLAEDRRRHDRGEAGERRRQPRAPLPAQCEGTSRRDDRRPWSRASFGSHRSSFCGGTRYVLNVMRAARFWASSTSSVARKQCACVIAVSVRLRVVDELVAVRQRHAGAVDVARLLLVDEEQVAPAGPPGDVDVLADLDEAVGAEDRQARRRPRWTRPSGVNQSTRM